MTRSRRVVLLVVVAACAVGALWLWTKRGGSGGLIGTLKTVVIDSKEAIERWAGEQLLAIANAHLKPQLAFTQLRFELPATLHLSNVTLTSEHTQIVKASEMRIEFRETPKVGQPIVIQTVELTDPVIRFIEQPSGNLLGFGDLVKKGGGAKTPDGGSTKLSDVFVIRRIAVANGTIHYEPLGQPAMYLDQMAFELAGKPATEGGVDSAGWYGLNVKLARPPVLDWATEARLNIDTAALDIRDSTLHMSLAPQQYEVLPPPLQAIMRRHEVTGDYTAKASGILLLRDTAASELFVDHRLTDGHIAFGEYQVPLDSLEVKSHLHIGALEIDPIAATGLGGTLNMSGRIALVDPRAMSLTFDARGMRIEQVLRPLSDQPPKYSGKLDCNGSMSGNVDQMQETFQSSSRLDISEARLINLAVVGGLVREAGGVLTSDEANDRGSADVQLDGRRALFTNIDVVSKAIAARGEGTVNYDSTISFRLNAGPLERLQGAMGKIGELVGKVTDKLVWYEITGTLEEPVVEVKPLGL